MPGPHSLLGDRLREQAAADPAAWWAVQARERLHWDTPFSSVLDDSNPPFYTWFADGTINVSYNCLDRHVLAGRGGLAPTAVREQLETSRARALIIADGARRKGRLVPVKHRVDRVISDLPDLETVVVVRSTGADRLMRPGRDVWFDDLIASAHPLCPAEPMEAEHPLFLLYSSGSAAKPKGILHTTGGYLTGATTTAMVFDLDTDRDIFWCTADVGWITGHSYIVYGPLANGCTSVMFEGCPDYPDKDVWWEIVERYGVTIFCSAPNAIRACMKWGRNTRPCATCRRCGCSARSPGRSTPRHGCGITRSSAASAARSWTPGGKRRPEPS